MFFRLSASFPEIPPDFNSTIHFVFNSVTVPMRPDHGHYCEYGTGGSVTGLPGSQDLPTNMDESGNSLLEICNNFTPVNASLLHPQAILNKTHVDPFFSKVFRWSNKSLFVLSKIMKRDLIITPQLVAQHSKHVVAANQDYQRRIRNGSRDALGALGFSQCVYAFTVTMINLASFGMECPDMYHCEIRPGPIIDVGINPNYVDLTGFKIPR